jgi:general secretion pathway protein A
MYHQYFGLSEAPFSIAVNPRYLFMSARHKDALAHLLYGVGAGGGFILLTGEVGTGKTTINRCLLEQLPEDTDIAIILNPALNALELLASVCDELGIAYEPKAHTLKSLTDSLHQYLLDNYERGRRTVLLIDEAQHLDFEVMEQIRLLTNLETNSEKLLQIILIGQPELAAKLARPELRQLNQRITARYNLEPLNLDETDAYIRHRLQVAGMSADRTVFPATVVRGIYRSTRGIPRVINVLCDRILLGAYGRNKAQADQSMLRLAVKEVLGEGEVQPGFDWRWPMAIVAGLCLVLLVVLLGGQWLLRSDTRPVASTQAQVDADSMAAVTAHADATGLASSHQGDMRAVEAARMPEQLVPSVTNGRVDSVMAVDPTVPPDSIEADFADVVVPVSGPAQTAQLPVQASVPPAGAEVTELAGVEAVHALLDKNESMARLWSLYVEGEPGVAGCPSQAIEGVQCSTGESATWDALALLNRPLYLEMITPDKFSAGTLLLGVSGDKARVLSRAGLARVDLASLAPMWTGNYRYLWHVPQGLSGVLAPGDTGPEVTELALLFARLDSQSEPLTREFFNEILEQRVRLFQQAQGLLADGVVGEQTLLALNRELGIDPSLAEAEFRLLSSTNVGE